MEGLPAEALAFAAGCQVTDCSFSQASRAWRLDGPSGSVYLKEGPRWLLEREAEFGPWYHRHGLGARVLGSGPGGDARAWVATEALAGENGIAPAHLAQPERLAAVLGQALRRLHDVPIEGWPHPHRGAELQAQALANRDRGVVAAYLVPEPFDVASRRLEELMPLAEADTVVHGDACLPNLILNGFEVSGFVDLGAGGVADRHYDLFWGLWTLEFNLKTDRWNPAFLEAYGGDRVDPDRLEGARLLSGFLD